MFPFFLEGMEQNGCGGMRFPILWLGVVRPGFGPFQLQCALTLPTRAPGMATWNDEDPLQHMTFFLVAHSLLDRTAHGTPLEDVPNEPSSSLPYER